MSLCNYQLLVNKIFLFLSKYDLVSFSMVMAKLLFRFVICTVQQHVLLNNVLKFCQQTTNTSRNFIFLCSQNYKFTLKWQWELYYLISNPIAISQQYYTVCCNEYALISAVPWSKSPSLSARAWSHRHWQLAWTLCWNLDKGTRVGTVSIQEKN